MRERSGRRRLSVNEDEGKSVVDEGRISPTGHNCTAPDFGVGKVLGFKGDKERLEGEESWFLVKILNVMEGWVFVENG